jgi:hypothetical protein
MPEELYNTPSNNSGVASGWLAVNGVGQQDQALQGMNEDTKAYIETLAPEERQKAIDEFNAPLSGMEVYEALKQSQDFKPTHEEYTKYLAYDKEHKTSVLEGLGMLGEGMSAVMGDLGKAAGAVIDHPMSGLAKAPASLIEAFAQGTRNLYGMVAQSASPDSVLFKVKNALAGDGTVDGYNQFLEARKFNKHSARLAAGEDTLVMDKDVIDHDMTLAMSYIADPTLFIPFGNAASAAMKAVGMGEKIALMGSRAASIKAAIIGGGLKWGVGAPIEALASVTRGTIERGAALGGAVLETTTGISAAELKATAKLSAAGTTTASALGGHIPIISDISNVYVASGAARGFGEAISAVGEQIQKQGFNRGYNSFAKEALLQTKGLSPHAQGLLKVLDAVDPMFSYGYGTAVGAGHGALIGGTLGYLNSGEEGMYHGMGAGIALGATGAMAGRMFADVSGGTKMARAEIQGGFVIENMRADKHPNLAATELYLELATRNGDRAGALQVIAGLDRIAPDMRLILGNTESQKKLLQSKGLNAEGFKVDPKTGKVDLDAKGNPIRYEAPLAGFYGGEGFTMHTEKDGNGKQQVTVVINTDALANGSKNVMHHELFHAVFKTTIMEGMFRQGFAEAILGKFDANGVKVKDSEINPKEFKAFVTRELANTVDPATNKKLAPAELARRLKEFDYHLAEYQKAGTTTKMNPDSAKALNYLVEEFGAHYATQFMKGKPVDYLFHGAEYTGMQGVMDRLHNGFLDFWQGQTGRQNPTFGDFTSKSFDESFGPNKGKRTLDQRSPALDYMVQDLLRSVAGKRKGSTNSFDVRTMSPEARNAYFNSSGMDGVRAYYDKNGNIRNVTEAQVKTERLEVGKAIHESLSKLDPKETAGLIDADGNFGSSSTLGTKFNDTVLAHLVKEGHISQQLAERIKNVQDIVSGQGSNRVAYLYKGASMETEVGPNSPRLYGKDVPITSRETIVVGYSIKIKKDGGMSLVMKGLDAKVIDARGNAQWAKPEVRALWQGDRNAFDQSFFEYLSNASKASTDRTRVESSLLPSLAMGDGLGAERRNVMHQFLGMAKRKDAGYFNMPIAEIPRGKTSVVTNFTMDTMSPMRSDTSLRYDFNLDNAHSDLSRNFKVSDMEHEKTPQGDVFTHASKYKIVAVKDQQAHLYDAEGKSLGTFKDKDVASVAMEKAYKAERIEVDNRIERIKEDQQAQQQNFKVWDDKTMEEGRRLGDIFETEQGKAFHHGTTLIRQTREEFYSDNFTKLRQADPDTVMAVTEQIAQRGYALRDLRTKAYDRVQAEAQKGKGREYKKARDEYDVIVSHADRYNDILLAYERAIRAKTNGQGILDYINTHRRTSTGYDNMAKVFFGDHYDSQFQTGKPVTTVATHGTSSHELLTSREFDPAQSGSKHGAEHDKVGIFLSGETKTSFGYADPKEKDFGYRQVRAAVKFNNPLVVDAQFKCYSPDMYEGFMRKVKDGGHDGVIIKNVYDGGSADTVFIINNDSVKANTAIIDTHIGMERVTRQSEQVGSVSADSDQGSVRYPIQESMPRGKGVRVGSDLGMSWKVADGVARETGFDKFLKGAELSGRLRKGVKSEEFAGRPVVLINYDNSGVWNLIDSTTGEVISTIQGGALHNVISGKINPDKQAAVLASVNSAGLKGIEAVRQKAIKSGKPLTFLIISGNETKSFSHPQVGGTVTSLLAKFVQSKAIDPAEVNTLIKAMSEAFSTKTVKNKDGTNRQIRVPQGDLLKPLIGRPAAEQIAFLEKQFFPQDKSTFNNRGETMDRLVQTFATLPNVIKNKDYFQKFFNNPEMKMSGKDFQREFLKLTDEPMTRTMGGKGESLGYGKIVAALEVPQNQPMVTKAGGHEGFPVDYRSVAGKDKTTPAVMSVFEVPRRITDMVSPPHGRDVNPHYISKSGKIRSSSELIMNTTSTFGEGVVRESSHDVRKDNLSKATTKEKTLAGKPAFKVADTKEGHILKKQKSLIENPYDLLDMLLKYRAELSEGGRARDMFEKSRSKVLQVGSHPSFGKDVPQREIDAHIKALDTQIEKIRESADAGVPLRAEWQNGLIGASPNSFFNDINRAVSTERMNFNERSRMHIQERYTGFKEWSRGEMTADYSSPEFYSQLNKTVEGIFRRTVGKDESINPARLLNLIKSASGGDIGKILTESDAIGLTEFLKSKGQQKIPISEIRKFLSENQLDVTVDAQSTNVNADFGKPDEYVAEGDTNAHHTFVVRTNDKYSHGVKGHFGESTVHIRATERYDNDGTRVLFVEEIQSQNAQDKQISVQQKAELKAELNKLKPMQDEVNASLDKWLRDKDAIKDRLFPTEEGFRLGSEEDKKAYDNEYNRLKIEYLRRNADIFNRHQDNLPKEMQKELLMGMAEGGSDSFFHNLDGNLESAGLLKKIKENENKIAQSESKGANAPLQEYKETVKLASRTIMRKAVELGLDRVVFTQSRNTHPDVAMRNERGRKLYDVDIPAMVASDIKKFGGELKPANNTTSHSSNQMRMLGENPGYNITPKMAETLRGQPTYKVSDTAPSRMPARAEGTPDLKPFEGKFKVSDAVKTGVAKLDETLGRLAKTENLSPSLRDAMKALKDAVRKQDATDEVLIPELREAYDAMTRSIEDQMAGASLTPIDSLKEIQKVLKPLDKKIQKNTERIQKNIKDSYEADMAEGADVESQTTADRRTAARRDMEEGASLESDQATAEIDRRRGDARLDVEEGATLDSNESTARIQETVQDTNDGSDIEAGQTQASRQNLPPQFPNPAPPVPAGLPSYKPSGTPAFPRPPATPAMPQVKPSGAVPFPRPPTAPAVPRGSIAPPPPQGTPPPNPLAPSLTAAKPLPKLSAWRGWTLEKGLNGGFWKNAVGWMIVVQADKFKVYNPQRAMQGIYEDLEAAKRRVQRAEPKQ